MDKNDIIMVNSFKGGAGKSSIALSYCIHNLKNNENNYRNIFFIDIDILGTGLSYTLDEDNTLKYMCDNSDDMMKAVNLIITEKEVDFYALVLDPVSRVKNEYSGKSRLRENPEVMENLLRIRIKNFMEGIVSSGGSNLFVIDCSPGLSNLELQLISDFNDFIQKYNGILEEVYVSTFDSSHLKKTIDSLNNSFDILHQKKRKVSIVLNDIHNCKYIKQIANNESTEQGKNFYFELREIIDEIKKSLKNMSELSQYNLLYKEYSETILTSNIIKNEKKLKNNLDSYIFSPSYFKNLLHEEGK